MFRRAVASAFVLVLALAGTAIASSAVMKSPPWLSIESPVNPYDPTTRDALLLVHAAVREGRTSVGDLAGSAEGIVNGQRRSVALTFQETSRPDVYAVRKQWPTEGTWMLRITLLRSATALVTLGPSGEVVATRVPTTRMGDGMPLPRAVAAREIDSTLTVAARPR